jgi:UDP-GlcNAc3NAcA epimerase
MIVATIIGARPQFIKAAPVSRALKATGKVKEILIHTGQHYDQNMSAVFFEQLQIPAPEYNLGIGSGSHGQQTGRMLEGIEQILVDIKPSWVLLFGDTNSTLAGILAAAKLGIPTAHIEAGLRSFNRWMPEEVNRVVTDHLADLLFAPTQLAVNNLTHEGITKNVHLVGDVMYDAALQFSTTADQNSRIVDRLGLRPKEYLLATLHRADNVDNPSRLTDIVGALASISREIQVVFPVHPRTQKKIKEIKIDFDANGSVKVIDPVGYLDMIELERKARIIVTDSGGVQKEAYFHRVPCVILRDETEWEELIAGGSSKLASPKDSANITRAVKEMTRMNQAEFPKGLYGEGNASEKIVSVLLR